MQYYCYYHSLDGTVRYWSTGVLLKKYCSMSIYTGGVPPYLVLPGSTRYHAKQAIKL